MSNSVGRVGLDLAAYKRAAALMGETVAGLTDDEWERSTRPSEWTVVSTVAWVVVGDAQIADALRSGVLHPVADFDAAILGVNPVATWRGTAVAAIQALGEPGAFDRVVDHPEGSFAVADLVAQRVSENLVRAWDIGMAVGRPVEVPDDLADACLDFWAQHADEVLAGGVLPDMPIEPADDATPAVRFLALMGRGEGLEVV